MRQLLLLAAMAASVHVSAQKYTPVTGTTCGVDYARPCSGGMIPDGYSYTDYGSGTYYLVDPFPMDVHGTDGTTRNEIYSVGIEVGATPNRSYFIRRNASTGQITQIIQWSNFGQQAGTRAVTYDNTNDRLFIAGVEATSNVSGSYNGYFKSFSYTLNLFNNTYYLPLASAVPVDILVDPAGDVYVLCHRNGLNSGFIVYKYTFNGILLGTLSSASSITGFSTASPWSMEYDNNFNNIYICGNLGSAGFICGIDQSLSVLGTGTDVSSSAGYTSIDMDNNGNLFAVGSASSPGGNYASWAEWDVSTSSYSINYTGSEPTAGIIADILIDPNNRHTVLVNDKITEITSSNMLDMITNAGTLPTGVGPYLGHLHRNVTDGNYVVSGLGLGVGGPNWPTEYVAKFNYTGGPTGPLGGNPWSGYENKSTTSVSSLDKDNSIVLHPNPTTNRLSIDLKNNNADNYRIINNMGQMVSKGYMLAPRATIDVSMLQPGQYYLQLLNNTQTINTQTFTKQ